MTRDEAIKIADSCGLYPPHRTVDTLVALGLLKLGEPQQESIDDRLCLELGWTKGGMLHTQLCKAIQRAGLKIEDRYK